MRSTDRSFRVDSCGALALIWTLGLAGGLSGAAAASETPRASRRAAAAASPCRLDGDNPTVKAFKIEAERLFDEEIFQRWRGSQNVWRSAWALDTILDYFTTCGIDVADYGDAILNVLEPTKLANWWDDFGWIGIASLRASGQVGAGPLRDDLAKVAINSWAYMHGPGWSTDSASENVVPFTDIPGWCQFANGHGGNLGAPNVWDQIKKTWHGVTEAQRLQRQPRFAGGAWNSPFTDGQQPWLVDHYDGEHYPQYLNPIQNTVTNGLYAILTLRIWRASEQPELRHVFEASKLDPIAALNAWKGVILWLDDWAGPLPVDESLVFDGAKGGILFRERVSTFDMYKGGSAPVRYWDAVYRTSLAWTGDQGLLFGALRESEKSSSHFSPVPDVLKLFPKILDGVFKNAYQERTYGDVKGSFLLPWVDSMSQSPFFAPSPGGDYGDYQTGNAVFMRYVLQAAKDDPTSVTEYKDQVLAAAGAMLRSEFGPPRDRGLNDAYTPYPCTDEVTTMTPYVNRLALLLLAIELAR